MKAAYWILISCSALLQSCFVYSSDLLEESEGAGTGSRPGGDGGSGGSVSGGGGTTGGGGTDLGGAGNGASDGGGGTASGGDGSGGDGSGGTGARAYTLVDDLEHESIAGYANPPFTGIWDRFAQAGVSWEFADVKSMVVERADEAGNFAFKVKAADLDDWGVGVYVTLNEYASTDVSAFTGVSFWAKRVGLENKLKVHMEDESSNIVACGDPCAIAHAESNMMGTISTSWKQYELPLSSFKRAGGDPEFDASKAYSIHFVLDPDGEEVEFWIDDVQFYKD